jgi:hypothetical protein
MRIPTPQPRRPRSQILTCLMACALLLGQTAAQSATVKDSSGRTYEVQSSTEGGSQIGSGTAGAPSVRKITGAGEGGPDYDRYPGFNPNDPDDRATLDQRAAAQGESGPTMGTYQNSADVIAGQGCAYYSAGPYTGSGDCVGQYYECSCDYKKVFVRESGTACPTPNYSATGLPPCSPSSGAAGRSTQPGAPGQHCAQQMLAWSEGGRHCEGLAANNPTLHGASTTVRNSNDAYVGDARFGCSNGAFTFQQGTCSAQPAQFSEPKCQTCSSAGCQFGIVWNGTCLKETKCVY